MRCFRSCPNYNKPMQSAIGAHFQAIAEQTALPIILHDIPSRTIRAEETIARLPESGPFIGLRDETGDVGRPMRLSSLVPPGFRLKSRPTNRRSLRPTHLSNGTMACGEDFR